MPSEVTITGTVQKQAWLDRVLPPVERVRPGLWSVPVPMPGSPLRYVTMYVLELRGDRGVAVVDTGWPTDEAWDSLVDGLGRTGHAITDVRAVLVTHAHADHHGLAARVREASGAWVGLHAAEVTTLTERRPERDTTFRQWLDRRGAPPDEADEIEAHVVSVAAVYRGFADPDVLIGDGDRPLGPDGALRAIWTPGHTPGHLCFLDEERDVLLTGDHVLPRISPNISLNPYSVGDPLRAFLASLERIAEHEPDEVLPAHEYRFRGLGARVRDLVAHHHLRLAEVEEVLRSEPGATTWRVAERLTWSRPWEQNRGMTRQSAVSETFAHLAYLVADGRVADKGDTVDSWYVTAP